MNNKKYIHVITSGKGKITATSTHVWGQFGYAYGLSGKGNQDDLYQGQEVEVIGQVFGAGAFWYIVKDPSDEDYGYFVDGQDMKLINE